MAENPNPASSGTCCAVAELPVGRCGELCEHGPERPVPARLRELGLVPGTPVSVVRRGPLGGPIELELRGYRLVVRRADLAALCARPLDARSPG